MQGDIKRPQVFQAQYATGQKVVRQLEAEQPAQGSHHVPVGAAYSSLERVVS
ncbi:hypothetical protein M378DRAFT_173511 [Amanita muscaria Koide BX008]|uniref:Uncharacterized protein n=1 Tax=Amanita muscaria (strain Koide BX008) TaxID=946122 RepID=A0A0C2WG65_AMAMK|nr:hypothetical protein M378DRAFT_173511 [Amanita muscaria Koide BX008]